jgi:hypothetical protein
MSMSAHTVHPGEAPNKRSTFPDCDWLTPRIVSNIVGRGVNSKDRKESVAIDRGTDHSAPQRATRKPRAHARAPNPTKSDEFFKFAPMSSRDMRGVDHSQFSILRSLIGSFTHPHTNGNKNQYACAGWYRVPPGPDPLPSHHSGWTGLAPSPDTAQTGSVRGTSVVNAAR